MNSVLEEGSVANKESKEAPMEDSNRSSSTDNDNQTGDTPQESSPS